MTGGGEERGDAKGGVGTLSMRNDVMIRFLSS